jgi:hypothetical protein
MQAWLFAVVKVEFLLKMNDARATVDGENVRLDPTVAIAVFVGKKTVGDRSLAATVDRFEPMSLDVDNAEGTTVISLLINRCVEGLLPRLHIGVFGNADVVVLLYELWRTVAGEYFEHGDLAVLLVGELCGSVAGLDEDAVGLAGLVFCAHGTDDPR